MKIDSVSCWTKFVFQSNRRWIYRQNFSTKSMESIGKRYPVQLHLYHCIRNIRCLQGKPCKIKSEFLQLQRQECTKMWYFMSIQRTLFIQIALGNVLKEVEEKNTYGTYKIACILHQSTYNTTVTNRLSVNAKPIYLFFHSQLTIKLLSVVIWTVESLSTYTFFINFKRSLLCWQHCKCVTMYSLNGTVENSPRLLKIGIYDHVYLLKSDQKLGQSKGNWYFGSFAQDRKKSASLFW